MKSNIVKYFVVLGLCAGWSGEVFSSSFDFAVLCPFKQKSYTLHTTANGRTVVEVSKICAFLGVGNEETAEIKNTGGAAVFSEIFEGYNRSKTLATEVTSLRSQLTTKNNEVSQLQSQLTEARKNITTDDYAGSLEQVSELLTTLRDFLGDEGEKDGEKKEKTKIAELIRRFKEMQ